MFGNFQASVLLGSIFPPGQGFALSNPYNDPYWQSRLVNSYQYNFLNSEDHAAITAIVDSACHRSFRQWEDLIAKQEEHWRATLDERFAGFCGRLAAARKRRGMSISHAEGEKG
ncbi:MAG: hypothetical protein KF826_03495 [Xanthobacteraceae bacterium]|nr:hypothetical protein [Xanthobacteraceae bacterium]